MEGFRKIIKNIKIGRIGLYAMVNQMPGSVFWLYRKKATWTLNYHAARGCPDATQTSYVFKVVFSTFLKILMRVFVEEWLLEIGTI